MSSEDTFTSKGDIQKEKKTYTKNTAKLKDNHILMVMVNANKGELVSHPLILGKPLYDRDQTLRTLVLLAAVVTLFMYAYARSFCVFRID